MIVVAGEALIDLVAEPDGRYRAVPGGSPANVAVGLARLGVRTELLARLGAGRFGEILREHLTGSGVGLSYAVAADEPATLAVVSLDEAGRAGYDFYVEGTADWAWTDAELPDPLPRGTSALCLGSLAIALEPGAAALNRMLAREHDRGEATVVLDPNFRPTLLGSPADAQRRLDGQLALADVVKVSDEDLAWLTPGADARGVAEAWLRAGPALVVVTRGDRGAYAAASGGSVVEVPATAVEVIDTVGAGDAFTAGLVDALGRHDLLGGTQRNRLADCSEEVLTDVVRHAATVAAMTCGRRGADPPTADELEAAYPPPSRSDTGSGQVP